VLPLEGHNTSRDYALVTKSPESLPKGLLENDPNAMYVDFAGEDGTKRILKKYFSTVYESPTIFRMVILEDITEELDNIEKIRFQGYHDSLTGLHNRNYFNTISQKLKGGAESPLAVIIGDINGLKLINDIFGHAYGDEIIQKVASILKRNCPQGEILRMGGDEFYIFIHDADKKLPEGTFKRLIPIAGKYSPHTIL
jgi:predicted signal transduction protein with EAL and GGDEF domain